MSKKNKKNKWKQVELTTVLAETRPVTAWADEVEIDERELQMVAARKSALPTAPRSARGTDDERVPNAPPYVAYITNIPFEMVEEDLYEFFGDLMIENIRLPKHDGLGKLKGYGYVEFTERQGLIEALQIPDTTIKGRRIRIDVSDNNDRDRGYGRSDRMGRDRMGMGLGRGGDEDPDRALGDWRSAPRVEPAGEDRMRSGGRSGYGSGGFGDREGREGGFGAPRESDTREGGWRENLAAPSPRESDSREGGWRDGMGSGTSDRFGDRDRDSFRSRGFGDRDRDRDGFDRDRGGGGRFGDRDGDRYGDRPRFGDRDGDRPRFGDRDSDRPRFGDRDGDRYGDRPRYGGDRDREDGDRFPRREEGPPSSESSETRARPRLNLQPRTRPVETPAPPPEVLRERELEEREKKEEKKVEAPAAPRASIFGAAKPVDTTAREREIEDRLARERDRAPRREERDRDRSSENQRSKDGDAGDESQSKKAAEPAPPPKENAWSRRPRIEPSSNNGEGSRGDENDERASSPKSYSEKEGRPASGDRGRQGSRPDGISSRSPSRGTNKDCDSSVGKGDSRDDPTSRSHSTDKQDNKDEEGFTRAGEDNSSSDRPSRRDHSNDDPSRLPKYEEKPIPNFVASNKYAFLNEEEGQED